MAYSLLPLLLLLLLVSRPFSSAGIPARASPQLGRFIAKGVRSIIKKSAKEYMQDKAEQGVKDFSSGGGNGHQLGSSAANTLGTFVFDLSVGTSAPQTLQFVIDITSELVWARCGSGVPTATATFVPASSQSFIPIGCADQVCTVLFPDETCSDPTDYCAYKESLYSGGETNGYLASETFTFGTSPVTSMVFGCSDSDTVPDLDGASGFAGFSRGPLSLVSQLQVSWFSYFIALPNNNNNNNQEESFVSWGDATVAPDKGKSSRHTPLLAPTANQNSNWYYVKLTGVQVDGQLLTDIPADTFDVQDDGSGGVFLSTTLPVTYLDQAAYKVLRRELLSRVQSEGVSPTNPDDENHLCFPTQPFRSAEVPRLALVFDGADAVMELDSANYFFDLDGDRTCLTILPSIGGSVLGSLVQTGRTMTYEIHDDGGSVLSFETFKTAAGAPTPAKVPLMIMATLLLWVLL